MNNVKNILPFDGEAYFFSTVFTRQESDNYFNSLLYNVLWKQQAIKIFGKEVKQPRLTAWYSDALKNYTYSGLTMEALEWRKELVEIRKKVQTISGTTFNSALLNLYRDGSDSVGWHRDNEKELGRHPVIGSVSLGATRQFVMRHFVDKSNKISIELTPGSLLLMQGYTQQNWEHSLPKTKKLLGARINITFRNII